MDIGTEKRVHFAGVHQENKNSSGAMRFEVESRILREQGRSSIKSSVSLPKDFKELEQDEEVEGGDELLNSEPLKPLKDGAGQKLTLQLLIDRRLGELRLLLLWSLEKKLKDLMESQDRNIREELSNLRAETADLLKEQLGKFVEKEEIKELKDDLLLSKKEMKTWLLISVALISSCLSICICMIIYWIVVWRKEQTRTGNEQKKSTNKN